MNIDIKDKITLSDNNTYVVVSKVNYQQKVYYYLIDENSLGNVKFCYENSNNNSVIEINDPELIRTLIPLFTQKSKEMLEENNNN